MADKPLMLSKSKYCRGFQCPKMLWMDANKPEMAEDILPEAILAAGTEVGDLARSYFGDYALVPFDYNKKQMAADTRRFIEEGWDNIAEASFLTDGLFCAVDILRRTEKGYDIVEVKSSTHVSDIYIEDMAFQNYVLTQCGICVDHVYNLHINSAYQRKGALDLKQLFVLEDCTEACKSLYEEVATTITDIRMVAEEKDEPIQDIGLHCETPYDCAYRSYCGRHLPKESIFDVRQLTARKKYRYYHDGIISLADIINRHPDLNDAQQLQVETAYYHLPPHIDTENIRDFLKTLSYPLYHLDFESYQQPIPPFDGLRPYAQIPFQYSLHIENADGSLQHKEFLAKEGSDPRRALAEQLTKDIPSGACVLAYNMAFERRIIAELAEQFADLSPRLMEIHGGMRDLMVPFRKKHYYVEAMKGSFSIKYVLPALYPDEPELDYQNLSAVHNGAEASAVFASMADLPPQEVASLRSALLKYCKLDTYAMVKILAKLREVTE